MTVLYFTNQIDSSLRAAGQGSHPGPSSSRKHWSLKSPSYFFSLRSKGCLYRGIHIAFGCVLKCFLIHLCKCHNREIMQEKLYFFCGQLIRKVFPASSHSLSCLNDSVAIVRHYLTKRNKERKKYI